MYPTSYHPDGSGRDMAIYHHGTRTVGRSGHVGATDSINVLPKFAKASKEKRECGSYHSLAYADGARSFSQGATPRRPGNAENSYDPWSKSTYQSTYRERHSTPAGKDFAGRHGHANSVWYTLHGSPAVTPRHKPPESMTMLSTSHGHFRHGEPETDLGVYTKYDVKAAVANAKAPGSATRRGGMGSTPRHHLGDSSRLAIGAHVVLNSDA